MPPLSEAYDLPTITINHNHGGDVSSPTSVRTTSSHPSNYDDTNGGDLDAFTLAFTTQGTVTSSSSPLQLRLPPSSSSSSFSSPSPTSSSGSSSSSSSRRLRFGTNPFSAFWPTGGMRRRTSSTTTVDWNQECVETPASTTSTAAMDAPPIPTALSFSATPPTKSVRFNTHYFVQNIDARDPAEHTKRWYVKEEYDAFKRDASHALFLSKNQPHAIDNVQFTFRGLEGRDEALWRERRTRRKLINQQIIAARQGLGEMPDTTSICQLAKMQQLAKMDAIDAMRYQQEPAPPQVQALQQLFVPPQQTVDECWLANAMSSASPQPLRQPCAPQRDLLSDEPLLDFSDDWLKDVTHSAALITL